jgi:hypothetical protein
MTEQPGFIYFECRECGFDSVQKADFAGSDACPMCDGDNHYSRMSQRVCRDTDRPEGKDARKAANPSPQTNVAGQPRCGVVGWPPVKKAIWDQVIAVNLNGKEYISAWNLTDRIYASVCEALSTTEGKDND